MAVALSIITTAYNNRAELKRTLESVSMLHALSRDKFEFEQIIIDGGSDYDVRDFVKSIAPRAIVISEKDHGTYDAMNKGLRISSGKFIMFLNSGDHFHESCIDCFQEFVENYENYDVFFFDSVEASRSGDLSYKRCRPVSEALIRMITHHQAMVFRRDILTSKQIFYNLSFSLAADYDFLLSFLKCSKNAFVFHKPLVTFYEGGASTLKRSASLREQFCIRLLYSGSYYFSLKVLLVQLISHRIKLISPKGYWLIRSRLEKSRTDE